MEVSKIDEKGRILISRKLRKKAKLRKGSYVRVMAQEKRIIIEPLEPIADKYFGVFKIARWPKDLDGFAAEAMRKWWLQKAT